MLKKWPNTFLLFSLTYLCFSCSSPGKRILHTIQFSGDSKTEYAAFYVSKGDTISRMDSDQTMPISFTNNDADFVLLSKTDTVKFENIPALQLNGSREVLVKFNSAEKSRELIYTKNGLKTFSISTTEL